MSLALRKQLHPENKCTTTRVRGKKNGEIAYTSLCAMVMRLLSCGISRVGLPGKVGDRENEVLRAFNVQHVQMCYKEGRDTSKNYGTKWGKASKCVEIHACVSSNTTRDQCCNNSVAAATAPSRFQVIAKIDFSRNLTESRESKPRLF